MSEPTPTPLEFVRAVFPGLFQAKVVICAVGAAIGGLTLGILSAVLVLSLKGQLTLAAGGVLAWGHGAAWLVTGEVESGPSAMTNLAGVQWAIFLVLWYAPVVAFWLIYVGTASG